MFHVAHQKMKQKRSKANTKPKQKQNKTNINKKQQQQTNKQTKNLCVFFIITKSGKPNAVQQEKHTKNTDSLFVLVVKKPKQQLNIMDV